MVFRKLISTHAYELADGTGHEVGQIFLRALDEPIPCRWSQIGSGGCVEERLCGIARCDNGAVVQGDQRGFFREQQAFGASAIKCWWPPRNPLAC